jgi:hypothetical protein
MVALVAFALSPSDAALLHNRSLAGRPALKQPSLNTLLLKKANLRRKKNYQSAKSEETRKL